MGCRRSEGRARENTSHPRRRKLVNVGICVGPEAQPRGSSVKKLGQEVSRPAFLDGAGELCLAKGGGWTVEKFFAASDPSSCQ